MKEKLTYKMPEAVSALGAKISDWRQRRVRREAMPAELWAAATRLGREFGVYPVSRDLNLHYGRLKRLVEGKGASGSRRKVRQGGFMELRAVTIPEGRAASTVVENNAFVTEVAVTKSGGATLRIRESGPEGLDLSGIVAAFLGKR